MPQKVCEGIFLHVRVYSQKSYNAQKSNIFILVLFLFSVSNGKKGYLKILDQWGIWRKNHVIDF